MSRHVLIEERSCGRARRTAAGCRVAVARAALSRAACRTIRHRHHQPVEQTDPADVLYNQGLANLNAGKTHGSGQQVRRDRPPASLFGICARKALVMSAFINYRQGQYEDAINAGKRYVRSILPVRRRRLCAVHRRPVAISAQIRDVTQDQKASRRDDRGDGGGRPAIPEFGICRGCPGQDPLCPRPARRQGNAGRPLLSGAQGISCRGQPLPLRRRELSNTNQVEEALARLAETYYAHGHHHAKRRRQRRCSVTTIRTAMVQGLPTSCCRPAALSRAKCRVRGFPSAGKKLIRGDLTQDARLRMLSSSRSAISS